MWYIYTVEYYLHTHTKNGTRKKIILSEVMKMQKDTFGIYVLQSLDPEKLGEKEGSRWRNTCVSWVYRNKVNVKV